MSTDDIRKIINLVESTRVPVRATNSDVLDEAFIKMINENADRAIRAKKLSESKKTNSVKSFFEANKFENKDVIDEAFIKMINENADRAIRKKKLVESKNSDVIDEAFIKMVNARAARLINESAGATKLSSKSSPDAHFHRKMREHHKAEAAALKKSGANTPKDVKMMNMHKQYAEHHDAKYKAQLSKQK